MADEDDRQPPQAYDTVAPAGVGAATSNQMSPRAWQDLYLTGDQGLLDVAMEEMRADALYRYMESLPAGDALAAPLQTSSPAGVGSPGSQSFRSIHTTPESSGARTPATPPSVPLAALPVLPCLRLLAHLEEEGKGGKLSLRDSTNYTGGLRSIQERRGGVFGTIR